MPWSRRYRLLSLTYTPTLSYHVGMVTIEMPNGARATLSHGVWSSSTLGLANVLEALMSEFSPEPADDDPEWAAAHHVAQRVSAHIIERTPSYDYASGGMH